MDHELRSIANLIRQRQPADARRALGRYLKAHPDSAEAWYLLSVVETDADKQMRAAQKAAALDPSNEKYGKRLARLLNEKPRPGRRWWLLLAVPVVLILIAIGVVWAAGRFRQPEVLLPTQAAFVPRPTDAPTSSVVASETVQPSPTLEPPAATNTIRASDTPSAIPPTATHTASATITNTFIAPTDTAAPIATATPTTIPPTAPPTSVPVAATVSAGDAIPLNEMANIGIGDMLVIDALRQAGTAIQERGGSAPPAPAGEDWVLVELLLICNGGANCAPDTSVFSLTGSSGRPYPPAAGFQLEPAFNSQAFAAGQVWGYLGFVVPNSESGLWLTLGQGSAVYRFALQ